MADKVYEVEFKQMIVGLLELGIPSRDFIAENQGIMLLLNTPNGIVSASAFYFGFSSPTNLVVSKIVQTYAL